LLTSGRRRKEEEEEGRTLLPAPSPRILPVEAPEQGTKATRGCLIENTHSLTVKSNPQCCAGSLRSQSPTTSPRGPSYACPCCLRKHNTFSADSREVSPHLGAYSAYNAIARKCRRGGYLSKLRSDETPPQAATFYVRTSAISLGRRCPESGKT
jgi:hypothetical protein